MGQVAQLLILLWKNIYVRCIRRHPLFTALQIVLALLFVSNVRRDLVTDREDSPFGLHRMPQSSTRGAIPAKHFPPQHPLDDWSSVLGPMVTALYYTPSHSEFFDELAVRTATLLSISKVRRFSTLRFSSYTAATGNLNGVCFRPVSAASYQITR